MKRTRLKLNPIASGKVRPAVTRRRKRRTSKRRNRRAVHHARRNPPKRSHQYILVAMVRTGPKRFKSYYWNGRQFTRDKGEAREYSQVQALGHARRLLPDLSTKVYALRLEKQ